MHRWRKPHYRDMRTTRRRHSRLPFRHPRIGVRHRGACIQFDRQPPRGHKCQTCGHDQRLASARKRRAKRINGAPVRLADLFEPCKVMCRPCACI